MSREDFVLVLKVVVRRSRPTTLLKKTTTQIFPYKFKKNSLKHLFTEQRPATACMVYTITLNRSTSYFRIFVTGFCYFTNTN